MFEHRVINGRARPRFFLKKKKNALAPLSDVFEPCAPEARPGQRLLDLFPDRVSFFSRKDFPKAETPPPSPGGPDVAARMLWLHEDIVEGTSSDATHLDELRYTALSERNTVVGLTACSVPTSKQFQSTCGWALQHGQSEWIHRTVAGRFRTPDAELTAIRFAVESAVTTIPGITRVVIFTSHLAAAKTACDPSVHSSQGHSLAVCRALSKWFSDVPDATIDFVDVPAKAAWTPHRNVNDYLRTLPRIPGARPALSLDSVRSWATEEVNETWRRMFFRDPSYAGRNFLQLRDTKGNTLKPSYLAGGTWLSQVKGANPSLVARMTRSILGHAPIGDYFRRFNIDEPHGCSCDPAVLETRDHLLYHCPRRADDAPSGRDWLLPTLVKYLKAHPWAFASGAREGVG